ncbi:MAG: VCBS repeat-containing protein [Acidobacteriota bacterium]|nr:VCBS repeat-containing protein [Acidobacteriota bacterium]
MSKRSVNLVALGILTLLMLAATRGAATPQSSLPRFERQLYSIEVQDQEGIAYDHPFLGGFNLPRPHLADIDGDGDLDLFVQEYSNEVMFFEQVGTAAEPRYLWRTDSYKDLEVGEWYHFADVDTDGDFDLLSEQRFSLIRFWRNNGGFDEPEFELVTETLLDTANEVVFSDRQNIPKVGDIDCDGRLDLMLGRLEGTITRYEADGVDDAGAPKFRHVTDNFQDIEIIGQVLGNNLASLHGANTMALEDIDGDRDLDLFWGDFFEPGLLYIENTGSCTTPSLRSEPEPFPLNNPILTSGYNAPAFGDIDGDFDNDLLVGVLGGAYNPNSTTIDNFLHLEQTAPNSFEVKTRRYVSNIDLGSETFPSFADLDGDGDQDMLVGNKIQPDDNLTGKLFRFENIGTPTEPKFILRGIVPEFTGAYHYAPAFGDLDSDGDLDILMGTWRDELMLVINDGQVTEPNWTIADSAIVKLTRGRNATPTLGDIDDDGDLDLFIGESSGDINFYRNDGGRDGPEFVLVDDKYGGIDAGRRSVPTLVDIDTDGDFDLVVGSEAEGLKLYRNNGTLREADFVLDETFDVPVHPFSAPIFTDVDGDGDADLFVGGIGGGLLYFENR